MGITGDKSPKMGVIGQSTPKKCTIKEEGGHCKLYAETKRALTKICNRDALEEGVWRLIPAPQNAKSTWASMVTILPKVVATEIWLRRRAYLAT